MHGRNSVLHDITTLLRSPGMGSRHELDVNADVSASARRQRTVAQCPPLPRAERTLLGVCRQVAEHFQQTRARRRGCRTDDDVQTAWCNPGAATQLEALERLHIHTPGIS